MNEMLLRRCGRLLFHLQAAEISHRGDHGDGARGSRHLAENAQTRLGAGEARDDPATVVSSKTRLNDADWSVNVKST